METTLIVPDGIEIGWDEAGEGRPVLLVHPGWLMLGRGVQCVNTFPTVSLCSDGPARPGSQWTGRRRAAQPGS